MNSILQVAVLSSLIAAGHAFAQTKASGVVNRIDTAKGTVTLKHEAIKSLNWPAMTMDFAVRDKKLLSGLKPEQKVVFEFVDEKGRYVVTAIK